MRQDTPTGERLLLLMLYVILLGLLLFALVVRTTTAMTFALVIVTVVVLIEMVFVLVVHRRQSLCEMCASMWCRATPPAVDGDDGGAHTRRQIGAPTR